MTTKKIFLFARNIVIILFTFQCSLLTFQCFSQGIAINTTGAEADNSAMLDINSTNQGALIPRMTMLQRDNLMGSDGIAGHAPATACLIYQTDNTPGYYYWNGSAWVQALGPIGTTGATGVTGATGADGALNAWGITGNTGTNSGNNFLGTTDNASLVFLTNNVKRMIIDSLSNVGIGTTAPGAKLDISDGTNNLLFNPSQVAGGDIKVGSSISPAGTNKNLNITTNGSGTVGSTVLGTAYSGSAWRSMWEFANVSSGEPELSLVKSGGNVGVGMTGTIAKLDIQTTMQNQNPFRVYNTYNTTLAERTYSSSDGAGLILNSYQSSGGPDYTKTSDIIAGTDIASQIRFFTAASGGSLVERVRIDKNGNVGIGTTSPKQKLSVNGDMQLSGTLINASSLPTKYQGTIGVYSGNMASHIVTACNNYLIATGMLDGASTFSYSGYYDYLNGNVYITPDPLVYPPIDSWIQLPGAVGRVKMCAGCYSDSKIFCLGSLSGAAASGTATVYDSQTGGSPLSVGTVRMIIDGSGNIGMGTINPKSKLQVVGLPEYNDNNAAIGAGLTVGAFYRTGDLLKVVH